ncbi:hypothetical protein F2Q70_00013001 [Brassica cretica]|uniref:Protein kinase domain-containing protein n=1 Tax=Brassica cretica TaxID=69181 RepID=A0A8S9MA12_BRACR|nr:hypothetical protein F2Q70_00013001 [Brassica cretica]
MRHMPEHPNVVTLKDTYEDEHAVHLVMELCEGVELFDRIVARGHYTERAAAVVTKTIMAVVQMNDKQLEVKKEVVVDVKQYSGVELIIKSGFGSTLPSKDDLIRTYEKFGPVFDCS